MVDDMRLHTPFDASTDDTSVVTNTVVREFIPPYGESWGTDSKGPVAGDLCIIYIPRWFPQDLCVVKCTRPGLFQWMSTAVKYHKPRKSDQDQSIKFLRRQAYQPTWVRTSGASNHIELHQEERPQGAGRWLADEFSASEFPFHPLLVWKFHLTRSHHVPAELASWIEMRLKLIRSGRDYSACLIDGKEMTAHDKNELEVEKNGATIAKLLPELEVLPDSD